MRTKTAKTAKTAKTTKDLFRNEYKDWVWQARLTARRLLAKKPTITIVDILNECPRPSYLKPNITGTVFKDKDFKLVGYVKSTATLSHGRAIGVWTLNYESMPFLKKRINHEQ